MIALIKIIVDNKKRGLTLHLVTQGLRLPLISKYHSIAHAETCALLYYG